jgi:hypothetical protein
MLWVGGAAFPLSNIASVAPYDCWRQVPAWHKVSAWAFIVLYSLAVLITPTLVLSIPDSIGPCIIGLAALGAWFIFLYNKNTVPAGYVYWYEVRISVTGAAGVTLAVWDQQTARELTEKIVAKIADPRDEFIMSVQNLNIGAINTTHGAHSPIRN